jgi:putative ABC transport system permease protein
MRADTRKRTQLPAAVSLTLAYRNVLRHKARSASIAAAVLFGAAVLALSQGFVEDVFIQLGEAIVHSQTGHIQIAKAGFHEHGAHQPDRFMVADPEGDKARIRSVPEVADVMARLHFTGLLNNGKADMPIVGEGIEPESEAAMGSFLKIQAGRYLSADDHFAALLGAGVAKDLRLAPGDRAVLMLTTSDGAMNTLDVEVVGVFQSFSKDYDSRAVKIPLSAAQELLDTRGANTLVVSLKRTPDTSAVAGLLKERTVWRDQEVRTWDELNDFYPKTVAMYRMQFGGLQLIILLMVVLSVMNAVNSSVFERTAEFGTARALGNRSWDILRLVVLENAILGLAGSAAGLGLAACVAYVISKVGIPMPPPPNADLPYVAYIRLTWQGITNAMGVTLAATILAALVPAMRVSRLAIATALRSSV